MPPRTKITKEQIIDATFKLVREKGSEYLHARKIAKELSISTQPIFKYFSKMADLIIVVKERALSVYYEYINQGMLMEKPFKGTGLKYIEFAKNEPNLFKFLFMDEGMHDYKKVGIVKDEASNQQVELIAKSIGCSVEDARLIELESWIFVHGIASMIVTNTIVFDDEIISKVLSDFYLGVKGRINNGSN